MAAPSIPTETKTKSSGERTVMSTPGIRVRDEFAGAGFSTPIDVVDVLRETLEESKTAEAPITEATQQAQGTLRDSAAKSKLLGTSEAIIKQQISIANMEVDLAAKQAFQAQGGAAELNKRAATVDHKKALRDQEVREVVDLINQDIFDEKQTVTEEVLQPDGSFKTVTEERVTKEGVGFLQWMGNQIALPFARQEARAAQVELNLAQGDLERHARLPSLARNAADNAAVKTTEATIAAEQMKEAAASALKANDYLLKAQLSGADLHKTMMDMQAQQAATVVKSYELGAQRHREGIASLRFDRKLAKESNFAKNAIEGYKLLGVEPPTENQINSSPDRSESMKRHQASFDLFLQKQGQTAFENYMLVNEVDPRALGDKSANGNQALTAMNDSVQASIAAFERANGRAISAKDIPGLQESLNANIQEHFKRSDALIIPGDTSNPNRMLPVSVLIQSKGLQDNKFIQHLKKLDGTEANLAEMNEQQLVDQMLTGAGLLIDPATGERTDKAYSLEEGVSAIRHMLNVDMMDKNDGQRRAFYNLPFKTGHRVKLSVPEGRSLRGIFTKTDDVVDIHDPNALRLYAVKRASATSQGVASSFQAGVAISK